MEFLMGKFGLEDVIEPISKIHGKVFEVKIVSQSIKVIPFYHPAVAAYNPNMKEVLQKDFQILKRFK
jgi:DNA polymerase